MSHADKRSSHRQRGYLHGESVVHRLDPRAKVSAAFVTLGAILGLQSWLGYIFMASVLLLTAALGRIPWRRLVGALQGVGLLLLFTVVVNGVFTPGEVLLRLGPVALTVQGLARGLALGCRLALIVGAMTLLLRPPNRSTSPMGSVGSLDRFGCSGFRRRAGHGDKHRPAFRHSPERRSQANSDRTKSPRHRDR